MYSKGTRNDGTTHLLIDTSGRISQIIQKSTDIAPFGQHPDNQGLPNAIVYIIVVLVCGFMILFGLFVGVYFYKHCIKNTIIIDEKGEHSFNSIEGYKSLNQPESNQAIENWHDSTYLEPVFDARLHYNEIENKEEITEEIISDAFVQQEQEEVIILSPRFKSCHFLVRDETNGKGSCDETISCTNSL